MTNRFLMSVAAAALIAGTGFAYAQGTGTSRDAPSTAQSAPSSAPSSATPMNSDKGAPAAKTTQSEDKAQPGGAKNQRAQDDPKAGDKGAPAAKTTQSEDKAQPGGAKNQRAQDDMKPGQKMNNAQSKEGMTKDGMAKSGTAKDGVNNAQSKPSPSGQTTGNAATSATAAPPAEKQSQIASAIKQERVEEVTNVNFNISVGAAIPGTVRFHRLPSRIVEIYPEWRGYDFILVRGRYIIVRPQTHEIVYIIEG